MSLIAIVLVFIMAIVVTVFLSHLLPVKVPLPLIQIAAGAALAASGFQVDFDPHIFLLLFIPPLLFLDGWRIPKDAFFRDMKPILSLAIGLVMVTILGIGLFIHWLIPAITVAAGFALAAILSPTDPVAVSAMTASSPLPSRMAHILEGESLLNDASGLVAFNFAIAAVLTGSFSPGDAVVKFFLMAFGGILSGLVVVWVTGKCNNFLVRRTREEPAIQILISLLIPFAAYLLAEAFHVSGILAAVAAGIAMHYEQLSGPRLPATRMKSSAVWSMLQTTLNGMIFLMLGEQLPRMFRTLPAVASQAGVSSPWYLLLYAVAITLALGLMRFAWVWLSMKPACVPLPLRFRTVLPLSRAVRSSLPGRSRPRRCCPFSSSAVRSPFKFPETAKLWTIRRGWLPCWGVFAGSGTAWWPIRCSIGGKRMD